MTDSLRPERPSKGFAGVVGGLTAANLLTVVLAFVSSPILARALGPSGRGEVAAIFAIVTIAPWVSELGMTAYLSRAHSRHTHPLGVLLGSTMPITFAMSLVTAALAVPIAHLLGRGRHDVVEFIEIGLFLVPVTVYIGTLSGIAIAEQRWGVIIWVRVMLSGGTTLAIASLSLLDALTVKTASTAYIVCGNLAALPYLLVLRGSRPWRFVPSVGRTGLAFGVRSWLSTIASLGNAQLDQILMAGLVSSRQLGLYSLAVTLSLASSSLIGATGNAIFSRVATGESQLAARACRVTLLLIVTLAAAIGATSPLLVPAVFGRAFIGAIPMLLVLLGASVAFVPGQVLGSALVAGGNPSATARGQVAGLLVTVPALLVALPLAGGLGAAWVSFAAYTVTFGITLKAASQTFAIPYRTLLMANRSDLRWLWAQMRRRRGGEVR